MIELVFIHGWGFDARFWDRLALLLSDFKQTRIDLDYFNPNSATPRASLDSGFRRNDAERVQLTSQSPQTGKQYILIGHSLGFMHGLIEKKEWTGWIAINSFERFTPDCVAPSALRAMQRGLKHDPLKTLNDFHKLIKTEASDIPSGEPNSVHLYSGLEELRDGNLTNILAALTIPGLVLASRNDLLVPCNASITLQQTDKADILWHETAGHLLPVREPEWCATQIRNFIQNHFSSIK